jgi:hypothetical protein
MRRARSLDELSAEEIEFLAEEAGWTATSPPRKRRLRKPKLADALKAAKKAGTNVTGATLAPDGSVSLTFGETAKRNGSDDLDQWMADCADQLKGH